MNWEKHVELLSTQIEFMPLFLYQMFKAVFIMFNLFFVKKLEKISLAN